MTSGAESSAPFRLRTQDEEGRDFKPTGTGSGCQERSNHQPRIAPLNAPHPGMRSTLSQQQIALGGMVTAMASPLFIDNTCEDLDHAIEPLTLLWTNALGITPQSPAS